MPFGHLYVFFGEMSSWIFCPFFEWVVWILLLLLLLNCMSCLYVWEVKPLSVTFTSFANSFFQSIGCLFILLMVSFAVQKLISLIRSHLFIFAFLKKLSWETDLRKHQCDLCQRKFYLCSLLGILWYPGLYLSL